MITRRHWYATCLLAASFFLGGAAAGQRRETRVLIFSLTKGYHHQSIAAGIRAIQKMGAENHFSIDTTTDPSQFNTATLGKYRALIFLSPTGTGLFTTDQQAAFKSFIGHGGGFVGIHAATDCLYDWDWYGQLICAYFVKHPAIQSAELVRENQGHISTRGLPVSWQHTDEWYNFRIVNPSFTTLLSVNEKTYQGGEMGSNHPVSWYHSFGGGRVFYTALGHTDEDFTTDTLFLLHLLGGIRYAIGR